jgi:hypothetical protein
MARLKFHHRSNGNTKNFDYETLKQVLATDLYPYLPFIEGAKVYQLDWNCFDKYPPSTLVGYNSKLHDLKLTGPVAIENPNSNMVVIFRDPLDAPNAKGIDVNRWFLAMWDDSTHYQCIVGSWKHEEFCKDGHNIFAGASVIYQLSKDGTVLKQLPLDRMSKEAIVRNWKQCSQIMANAFAYYVIKEVR